MSRINLTETKIKLLSFAKINLYLRVIGKRPDGYHEIETLFQQVDLNDKIILEKCNKGIKIICKNPYVPDDENNLCYKAAKSLEEAAGKTFGCKIYIHKKIPIAAGLGGGSSNAAVTLLGLNYLWNLNFDKKNLLNIANAIGSDVPFFIEGGSATGRGRGEILTPVNLDQNYWCAIASFPIKISSRWAYQISNFNLTNTKKSTTLLSFKKTVTPLKYWNDNFKNDLEKVVFNHYHLLKQTRDQLEEMGAFFARMSGSGSCIFGLFENFDKAQRAQELLKHKIKVNIVKPIHWGFENLNKEINN